MSSKPIRLTLAELRERELGAVMEVFDFAGHVPASIYLGSTGVKVPEACYRSASISQTRLVSEEYLLNSKRNSLDMGLPIGVFAYSAFGVRASLGLRSLAEEGEGERWGGVVKLPPCKNLNTSLGAVIRSRRSLREMKGDAMPLQSLSTILFFGDGVTGDFVLASAENDVLPEATLGSSYISKLRTAPSGGGLYPIYLYLVVQNVKGLPDGMYVYLPLHHALLKMGEMGEQERREFNAVADWGFNIDAAKVNVAVFYVYSLYENSRKYCDMGLTFGLIEAGEIAQNIHLACAAMNIASCDIGSYEKSPSEQFLGIDGLSKHLIHLTVIGMA